MLRTVAALFACAGFGIPTAEAARPNIATASISRLDQPWWRDRFQAKQAELHAAPVQLLWLGDSITQNWELDGPQPWRRFRPVWQRFYGDRHAVNLGFKGDSTCHLLWRIQHGELDGIAPKAVVLLIGANNFGHLHTDAAQTDAGIQHVLDEIHRRLPRARILLLGVLPSIRSDWVSQNTAILDADLQRSMTVRQSYATYVDLGAIFLRDGKVDRARFLDSYLTPPEPPLHPTAESQERMAVAIEPMIAAMLGDRLHR